MQSRIVSLVFVRKQLKFRECERFANAEYYLKFYFSLLDSDSFILYSIHVMGI